MGKKTIVPIKSNGYQIAEGTLTSLTQGERRVVTFDKKVIVLLIEYKMSGGQLGHMYAYRPKLSFWKNGDVTYNLNRTAFSGYVYNTAYELDVQFRSDYVVSFYNPASTMPILNYVAIFEDDSVGGDPMYLLGGTILYTDGTPTTDVAGAIQTLDTNKYKIKTDALVTIANATTVTISN